MMSERMRGWLVQWMYGVAATHFLVGLLLPWIGDLSLLDTYHLQVEAAFWSGQAPPPARAQQLWWMSLFGATLQALAVAMAALVHAGDRRHDSRIWGALILLIVVWAPQDMLISLRAACWTHIWIDCLAVLVMLPPLALLWVRDRRRNTVSMKGNAR